MCLVHDICSLCVCKNKNYCTLAAGVTVSGDKVPIKKKEVVKKCSTHQKMAIVELPSSDTDSQSGMEGNYSIVIRVCFRGGGGAGGTFAPPLLKL